MNILENIVNKFFIFEKAPQKVGLCHINDKTPVKKPEPSIKNKNVKLSDLMRRAS